MTYLSVPDANTLYEESVPIHLAILVRFKERIFLDLLKRLQDHNHGWVFSRPVDPVELELYDYFDVIESIVPSSRSVMQKNTIISKNFNLMCILHLIMPLSIVEEEV